MTRPRLFHYFRSSASYRVRIALNLKAIDYDDMAVDLRHGVQEQAEYRAVNPQGLVPMLEIDGQRIVQSLAIVDYLDSTRPDPRLIPTDAADRAHVLAMALVIACDVQPLANLRVVKYMDGVLAQPEATRDDWSRHWMREGFLALERMATERAGRFLFGDSPTLADICLVPQMFNARRLKTPLEDFPLLVRIDAEAGRLEAFAAAHPDRVAPPA